MEFMDGTWKKEINTWEELVGNNLLNQEAVIEGAVHSIRNMGDVAFVVLRPEARVSNEEATQILMEYLKKHVAKYALPASIEFRESLPKTLVGKVAYRILEEEELKKYA